MLTRWTVYTLADAIEAQVKGARPAAKLLRQFQREGRKHGRRRMSPEPMRHFVENATEIAISKIAEDFLEEKRGLEAELAGLKARGDVVGKNLKSDSTASGPAPDAPTEGDGAGPAAEGVNGSSGIGAKTGGPDLKGSLEQLKAERAAKAAAEKEAQRQARVAQAEGERDAVTQQVAVLERKLEDLPTVYLQLIDSCHETGELIWTSYRLGYQRGAHKRRVDEEREEESELEISFDMPDVLAEAKAQKARTTPTDEEADANGSA